MPVRAVADQLLDAYFSTFDGVFGILHAPSFRVEYDKYWREPSAAREVFVLQAQVCMALGAMASNDALQYGYAPMQWLVGASSWSERSSGRPRKRQPTFEELQLSCLLFLAETSGPKTERLCWVDTGDLVRKAMILNLHRDPTHLGLHKLEDAEMHRRLWATIMELNLTMSLQSAQPPLISPSDWDTRAPVALLDDEIPDSRHAVPSAQTLLTASLRLRLLIASSASTAGATMLYSERLRLHKELAQAYDQLKKGLAAQDRSTDGTNSHSSMADVVFSRYFLALHLPLLGKSIKDPAFYFSRRVCADVAIRMLGFCGIADTENGRTVSGIQQLFVNNSGVFRGLAMQPSYAVLLELVSSAEEQVDSMSALPALDEAQIHQYAEQIQSWMEKRLQAGSIEVHGCCFIAASRAFAASLNARPTSDVDKAMTDAAFQASKRCQDRLAQALNSLENSSSRYATPSGAHASTEIFADTVPLYEDWQDTFTTTGADDFFGFDWALLTDPDMPSVDGGGANFSML